MLPPTFESVLAPGTEIWAPLGYDASLSWACRTCRHLRMLARLTPGVDPSTAERELTGLLTILGDQFPTEYASEAMTLTSVHEYVVRDTRAAMLALVGAVVLVTLIACANAANLLLGRALRRGPEFAVRTALGASRGRLAVLVVAEGLVLALLAGALGIAIAVGGAELLSRLAPPAMPRLDQVGVDGRVLAFTLGLSLMAGLVASAVPLVAARRADLHGILKSGARGLAAGMRHHLRGAVVVAETALAVMLLAGATLLFRSLDRLLAVDAGFDPQRRLTMELQLSGSRYANDTTVRAFWQTAIETVRAVPGVEAAAVASQLPLAGNVDLYGVHTEERAGANPAEDPSALRYGTSADYIATMGIPLVAGRGFTLQDTEGSTPVVVINETMAERLYAGRNPIGHRFRMGGGDDGPWRTIVGVVGDTRHRGLDAEVEMQAYIPLTQWWGERAMTLVVRTRGAPASAAGAVRAALRQVEPSLAIGTVATFDDLVARVTAERRFALALFQGFALIALLLAATGIYGVLSANVVERTREIGIRAALGAPRQRILSLVVRQGGALALIGLVLGLMGGLAGS
ncbi:MAG TPA: FtsX-like permease family protein, partial [Gemmatimonadaceae bacterium]